MWDTADTTEHSKAGNLLPLGNPSLRLETLGPSGRPGAAHPAAVPGGRLCLLWLKPAGTGAGGCVLGVVLTPHAAFKEITAMLVNPVLSCETGHGGVLSAHLCCSGLRTLPEFTAC